MLLSYHKVALIQFDNKKLARKQVSDNHCSYHVKPSAESSAPFNSFCRFYTLFTFSVKVEYVTVMFFVCFIKLPVLGGSELYAMCLLLVIQHSYLLSDSKN